MKTYKGIIFDLDGTLLDTIEDLRDSVNDVMKIYGWKEHDTKACKQMVGNGFRKLITRALPEDKQKNELFIDEAVNQFSKAYQKRYLNKTIPYEGILKLLESLEEKGIKIAVVTNKPHKSAVKMVETLFGKDYFDLITGSKDDTPRKPNPATTKQTLQKLGCKAGEAIFFGDSDVDIETAKNADIEAIACSWGFRSFESLLAKSPSAIIDEPKYISKLF